MKQRCSISQKTNANPQLSPPSPDNPQSINISANLPAHILFHLINNSILKCNHLELRQLGKFSNLRSDRLLVGAIRLLEDLRMLLVPESQVRYKIVVECLRAIGESNGPETLGVGLGAAHVLTSEGLGGTGGADSLAQVGDVRLVGGLELRWREGWEAVDEGGDSVRHFGRLSGTEWYG